MTEDAPTVVKSYEDFVTDRSTARMTRSRTRAASAVKRTRESDVNGSQDINDDDDQDHGDKNQATVAAVRLIAGQVPLTALSRRVSRRHKVVVPRSRR
ncbi:hypothetical protein COLO4_01268, partial [Corchorus olitorius]